LAPWASLLARCFAYLPFAFDLIPLSSSQGLLSCFFAETHRMVLLPLFRPSSAPILAAGSTEKNENFPHIPVHGPLLDRIHALWAVFIGPSSGVCSCRMQQTCTKGRLVGSRLRSLRAAILRTGQAGTVNLLRCSIDVSRAEENRTGPWRARAQRRGLQIRSSDIWRAFGDGSNTVLRVQ
jgi:hypothetical protein